MRQASVDLSAPMWISFLARWSPFVAASVLGLFLAFFVGVGFQDSDNALGPQYSELLQAARAPAGYQLAMVFDAFGWLAIAVSMIAFSRIFRESAPVASTFIFLAGVGHLLGFLGGILRMTGVHDIAVLYAATSDSSVQASLRSSYLAMYAVIGGLFGAGDVLAAAGWLLVGWSAWTKRTLPRWLGLWAFSSGIIAAIFTPLSVVNAVFAFPLLLVYLLSGIVAFHVVFALKFWRFGRTALATVPP